LWSLADLPASVVRGAAKCLRPKLMTVATTFVGFIPIMWATETGSDVRKRIAPSMVGGMLEGFLNRKGCLAPRFERTDSMRWMMTFVMMALPAVACAQEPPALTTEKDRLSYAMGMDLGTQLKTRSVEIDPALFERGLRDALSGGKTLLTEEEARTAIGELQKAMMAKQAEAAKVAGEKNKAEGEAFLAANKAKEGVVTLPSGLQYKVLKAGDGRKPTEADTVQCQYRGTLVDGTEFDSSSKRGQPAIFKVKGGVIPGWSEALLLMPAGSTWQVVVPPSLAYGERGAGGAIGPNATLVFEIELVAIR
jgi:FKBP-type peptidyl-prolyl cis-trans isomerase